MIILEILAILGIFVLSYFLILRNFERAFFVLLILSVLLHKELFSFYHWDLMPVRAFMLALFCAGLTKAYIWFVTDRDIEKAKAVFKDPMLILLILLWVTRGVSIVFSRNLQASLLKFGFFTTVVALAVYMINHFKYDSEKVLKYIKFYIFIVFGLTLFGYLQYFIYSRFDVIIGAFWNIPGNLPRVGATFWDVNHYGALLAALLPVLGVLILLKGNELGLKKSLVKKLPYTLMFISLLATLLLTSSRTAWMIDFFAFVIFIMILFVRRVGPKGIAYVLGAMLIISIPFLKEYSVKSSPFRAKIKQYFHYRMDSFDSHMLLLTGAVQIFEQYPVLGGGYGSFFEHFSKTEIAPTFFGRDPVAFNTRVPAHTIWGELLSETGMIGISIYSLMSMLITGVLLYGALKLKDPSKYLMSAAMGATFMGWMIAGVFYSYNSEFFWILFFLFFIYGMGVFDNKFDLKKVFDSLITSKKTFPLVLIVLCLVLIFGGLGTNHLIPWDEAIYAKIAKNMAATGDFIVQRWKLQTDWYEKPPLFMWFMAASIKLFGITSWAVRLPSAIFGMSTVLLVYKFGKRLFNKTAGFISAFGLLTTVHFLYYSRASMLDVTATFFITLSLYLYYLARYEKNSKAWWFSGASIGLAVMTKGVVGLLPYPIIGLSELYLLASREFGWSKELIKSYLKMVGTSLLVFMPWHLAMWRIFGSGFINTYLGYHVWDRATEAIEDKGNPFFWYVIVLRVSMRLWFIDLLATVPFAIKRILQRNNKVIFLSIWAVFVFLFFSVAKSKLVWYIMPMYPALYLLIGHFVERVINYVMEGWPRFNSTYFKSLAIFSIVLVVITYLFTIKELVYTSDLTGSPARLLKMKDANFGVESTVYIDRLEEPLALFYTDGPFNIVDFRPDRIDRVPVVPYEDTLILVTKKGRYAEDVIGYDHGSKVVQEDGDWILWYFESREEIDQERLKILQEALEEKTVGMLNAFGSIERAPISQQDEYNVLLEAQVELLDKIATDLGFM
jgi:4-amino-4-deoxy-L-arabinose transferase-like glycosyltransferase